MSYYPITLDKERSFKYGMRALSTLEKKFKQPISNINFDELSIEQLATIFWAGLIHEDDKLTVDNVMDLIDEYSTMGEVAEVAIKAFSGAFNTSETIDTQTFGDEEKN